MNPIMDLRTNVMDLGLDPTLPGARDRACALAETLLAYCARCANREGGERLVEVDLLASHERDAVSLSRDPDSPEEALAEQDDLESTADDPANALTGEAACLAAMASSADEAAPEEDKPRILSTKELRRKSIERFTRLMAQSHGYGSTRARSKRFAGVVDAGAWRPKGGSQRVKAKALALLGGERPQDPLLAEFWRDAKPLDGIAEQRDWIKGSPIGLWGRQSRDGANGAHIAATIALQHLLDLALRVFIRERGAGVSDDELDLLLGNTLFMKSEVTRESGKGVDLMKGYEVSLSFDQHARLMVGCRRRVQRIGRALSDKLDSVSPEDPKWPELQCQALSPSLKMDAARFGSGMDFFVAASLGGDSTRARRVAMWLDEQDMDEARAREKERKHARRILRSGIVVANHAQDLVESCLEEVLGEGTATPIRFRPTETREVMVEARRKNSEAAFLAGPLTALQVLYDEELANDSRIEHIHEQLVEALSSNGLFGALPSPEALTVKRLASLDAADASAPVLVVQVAAPVRTRRGAKVMSSAWFRPDGKGAQTLSGSVTARALRLREQAKDLELTWDADMYTSTKLGLYDSAYGQWKAYQGLNLEPWELEHLVRGQFLDLKRWKEGDANIAKERLAWADMKNVEPFLHKIVVVCHELKYKYLLAQEGPFDLGSAWRSGEGEASAREGEHFVCVYGRSPKGAPARVAVMEYTLKGGVLHVGEVATGVYRMPKEDRSAETKQRVVSLKQLTKAYELALGKVQSDWAVRLGLFIDDLAARDEPLNQTLMVFSTADGQLLRESVSNFSGWNLLGATWRGFPFAEILREGPCLPDGSVRPNLGRTVRGAMAQQLMAVPHADVVLEPCGSKVRGVRVLRGVGAISKHNNPLITWEVLCRESGTGRISAVDAPQHTQVFGSFVDTLTDNLVRTGRVSRTPLPGKLVKILVEN